MFCESFGTFLFKHKFQENKEECINKYLEDIFEETFGKRKAFFLRIT